jgi:hypothetical protein
MTLWKRRIRAAIGMGLIWGAAAFGAGVLLARVPGFYSDLPFALVFAPLGFAVGIIFSVIFAVGARRRGFARLSLSRFAGLGAVSGLLLAGIVVVGAAFRGDSVWREFLTFGPALAMAGACCAAGSLLVARRAAQNDLAGASEEPTYAELLDDGAREMPTSRASEKTPAHTHPRP